MNIKKSTIHDLNSILTIIKQAQYYFKQHGIDQWQNNYPNEDTIKSDIDSEISYILLINHKVMATAVISFEIEPSYQTIYNGNWLSNDSYAVIHRIAVDQSMKGQNIASEFLNYANHLCVKNKINSIRIDTHENNLSMQKLLLKNQFHYCGDIFLEDKSKRIAFEKLVIK